jgi:hypothetical protein
MTFPRTRAQARALAEGDPTTRAGFIARTRKAAVGGLSAAAAAVVAAVPGQVADGVYTDAELWFAITVTAGGAVVGFAAVWRIPNASE